MIRYPPRFQKTNRPSVLCYGGASACRAATVSFLSGFTVYAVAAISAAYLIIGIIYTIKFKP